MKRLSIIAVIMAMAFLATDCTKEGPNGGNNSNYPEINTFVETYFSQTSIKEVRLDDDLDEIDVKLADKTEITFYLNYDWKKIDCEHSRKYPSVPTALVPAPITEYVTTNYPNNHIDNIEKLVNGGWNIELDNEREIYFDQDFNVVGQRQ